jgi:putative membrane protein
MRQLQAALFLVFLAIVGIFALQNNDVITVHFLTWTVRSPVALLTVAVYLLGMLTGWTVVAFVTRSIRRVSEQRQA